MRPPFYTREQELFLLRSRSETQDFTEIARLYTSKFRQSRSSRALQSKFYKLVRQTGDLTSITQRRDEDTTRSILLGYVWRFIPIICRTRCIWVDLNCGYDSFLDLLKYTCDQPGCRVFFFDIPQLGMRLHQLELSWFEWFTALAKSGEWKGALRVGTVERDFILLKRRANRVDY